MATHLMVPDQNLIHPYGMSDSATFNLTILVAIAYRWSLNPLGRDRWILESPIGKTFVVGSTPDGMPEITEDLRAAIAASSEDKTGVQQVQH